MRGLRLRKNVRSAAESKGAVAEIRQAHTVVRGPEDLLPGVVGMPRLGARAGARAEAHMADNSDLARSLYEGWNERNFDQLAEAIAPDGEIVAVGTGDVFTGPEGSRRYNAMWADGFPDGRITIDNIIAAGDSVVVEFTGRGTHTGTLVTSMGSISATGRPVTLKLCDVVEFRDGLVKSQRSYFDSGSLMAQLGLGAD